MDEKILEKTREIAEMFYGTHLDPDQIPINKQSADKLFSIHKDTILVKVDKNQNPIAWSVIIPTSIVTMNKFLNKEITEKDLLNVATKEKKFEALYLCSVFVVPEYRNQGYAKKVLIEEIKKLLSSDTTPLYYWSYSIEGKNLANSLSKMLKNPVFELRNSEN